VVKATTMPLSPRESDAVLIVQEGGWTPGTVLNGYGTSRPYREVIPEQSTP
jgi:hypothetical protein